MAPVVLQVLHLNYNINNKGSVGFAGLNGGNGNSGISTGCGLGGRGGNTSVALGPLSPSTCSVNGNVGLNGDAFSRGGSNILHICNSTL
jgi:hypothetical protein